MPEYQFDEAFERRLLAFLIRDLPFFTKMSSFIEEGYFKDDRFSRDIFRLAKEYIETYKASIPEAILRQKLDEMYRQQRKDNMKFDAYLDVVTKLYQEDLSTGREFSEDEVIQFAKEVRMMDTLVKGKEMIQAHKPLDPLLLDVSKVLSIGSKLSKGYNYFKETAPRLSFVYDSERETKVGTGIARLDHFLYGGLGQTEIGVIGAPTNWGKTALLVNFAFAALRRRKNVVYIFMEGGIDNLAIRFDQLISGYSKDQLRKFARDENENKVPNPAYRKLHYVEDRLKSPNLILQMFPPESVTVEDIDRFIDHEEMVSGFKTDLIIVDYLNLCKATSRKEETWWGQSYRDGKSMAVRRKVPLWTASQIKADEKVIKQKRLLAHHIAEATQRISADADVLLTIGGRSDEEFKKLIEGIEPVELLIFLAKNRNNPGHKDIPVNFFVKTQRFEELSLRESGTLGTAGTSGSSGRSVA